jgi:type I restriction enzyme S subunit
MSSKVTFSAATGGGSALVPKLRFPEFSGQPMQDLQLADATTESTERNGAGQAPSQIMGVSKVDGIVPMEDRLIAADTARYKFVRKDWFAYNPMRLNIGSIARWQGDNDILVSPDYVVFKCKSTGPHRLDPAYLDHFRRSDAWEEFVSEKGDGSVRVRIYYKDLARLQLALPSFPEQEKIADCLGSVDALIAVQGRKVEALRAHKKGLMQQLFPQEGETQPRLRFPEFRDAGEWEVKQLESVAKRGSGHTPSKSKPEYYNGGVKWISLADSKRLDQGLISKTEVEISEEGIRNSSAVLHKSGSVLISRDAGIGKSAIMAMPMAVSQHFIVWTSDDRKLSNWFLYHFLQRSKPLFEQAANGSTIKTIGLQFFIDLRFRIPSRPEQQRIADCLISLDDLIAAESQKLDTLKTHKKGLMQQLFPHVGAE